MSKCPTCTKIAEITARALSGGDLHGEMLTIAGLVGERPEPKEKLFSIDVEALFAFFVSKMGVEPKGIRSITTWKDALRLMIERDKIRPEAISAAIKWVSGDVEERGSWKGWRYVILSTTKLRKHWETLQQRMHAHKRVPPAKPLQDLNF